MLCKYLYVYPFDSGFNSYINIHKSIWIGMGINVNSIKKLVKVKLPGSRSERVVVLNWFEDRLNGKKPLSLFREFLFILFSLIFFKLRVGKVIWIRHNYRPHHILEKKTCYFFVFLTQKVMYALSDVKCTHLEMKGYNYLPHPLYLDTTLKLIDEIDRDIDFLIFGSISEYKGINELLSVWPENVRLLIVGKASSTEVEQEITSLITSRCLDKVIWNNEFAKLDVLNSLIQHSRFVIIPNCEKTMIVSGSFFHAISYGANILIRRNLFSNRISKSHSFVTEFDLDELNNIIKELEYVRSSKVMDEASELYSNRAVIGYWERIL